MRVQNSRLVGQIAVDEGLLTALQLEACLDAQQVIAGVGCHKRLGQVMVEKAFLTPDHLEWVLEIQRTRYQSRLLGDYELGETLGRGGAGAVLRARRTTDGETLALKFLSPSGKSDLWQSERFEREADVAMRLFHPNIVRTYGIEQHGDQRVLVMEYVDGSTLERLIRSSGRLEETTALALTLQLAQALAYLAGKRIVHRDIKPSNVMVNEAGVAKLLDLGIARHEVEDTITMTGQVIGTPDFMAPEQIRGEPLDVRTDVYALGATLYAMTTGRSPYAGRASHQATLMAHLGGDYADPRAFAPELSEATAELIGRALALLPEARYQDMESFARDLDRVLRGQPVEGLSPRVDALGHAITRALPTMPTPPATGPATALRGPIGRPASAPVPRPLGRQGVPPSNSALIGLLGIGVSLLVLLAGWSAGAPKDVPALGRVTSKLAVDGQRAPIPPAQVKAAPDRLPAPVVRRKRPSPPDEAPAPPVKPPEKPAVKLSESVVRFFDIPAGTVLHYSHRGRSLPMRIAVADRKREAGTTILRSDLLDGKAGQKPLGQMRYQVTAEQATYVITGATKNRTEVVLKAPVKEGTTWAQTIRGQRVVRRIIEVGARMTVAGREYRGVVKVRSMHRGSADLICYAPGVGMIWSESNGGPGGWTLDKVTR